MSEYLIDLTKLILKNSLSISKELEIEPLVCAIGGSVSIGLSNKASDIDVYMVTSDNTIFDGVFHKKINIDGVIFDFMCINIGLCERAIKDYNSITHKYPSCSFRSVEEEKIIRETKDMLRLSFPREMVGRIYSSHVIGEFVEGEGEKNYQRLSGALSINQLWDSYYCRAYGNYKEFVVGCNKVVVRKYLHIIFELMVCYYLSFNNEIMLSFEHLLDNSVLIHGDIKNRINNLLETNASAVEKKEKYYIDSDPVLNNWIEKNLEDALNEFKVSEAVIPMHTIV